MIFMTQGCGGTEKTLHSIHFAVGLTVTMATLHLVWESFTLVWTWSKSTVIAESALHKLLTDKKIPIPFPRVSKYLL